VTHDISNADAQERDYGRLERADGETQLRFTRRFPQRPETVWRALTEPKHLAAWFPHDIEGERATGARLRFVSRANEAPPFDGEMLLFDRPSVMEMRWGDDVLRFELRADGDGTILDFTDTFDELGKAARDGAGWHACFDLLAYELDGHTAPWSSADRWRQVHHSYVERLGAAASAIGPPEEWERVHGSGKDVNR
jgi:uncharacterized protein YndB with AHSA1/START domain